MTETVASSTLLGFGFTPISGSTDIGESMNGIFAGTYSSDGTLLDVSADIVITTTLGNGERSFETYTTSGDTGIQNGGAVPGTNGFDAYEVFLTPESQSGAAAPVEGSLHLDWESATTQELYLGSDNGRYTALVAPGLGTLSHLGIQTTIDTPINCFAAGTHIMTPRGETDVAELKVGDVVTTVRANGPVQRVIVWTGRRSLDPQRHAQPELVLPVRIIAGAFGPGLPARDLRVSPRHALYVDGVLMEAISLVNGATVVQEQDTTAVTYHHIELDSHDVVLAEGLAAESFLDTGGRDEFEGSAALVLHPGFTPSAGAGFCAPMVREGAMLESVRNRLLARAVQLGFVRSGAVGLTARAADELIPASPHGNALRFALPAGVTSVELLSPAGVPAQFNAQPADIRRLGTAITRLTLIAEGRRIDIALDDARHAGFHDMEATHRWTNGAAVISLPPFNGAAVLEVVAVARPAQWVLQKIRKAA